MLAQLPIQGKKLQRNLFRRSQNNADITTLMTQQNNNIERNYLLKDIKTALPSPRFNESSQI